MERHDPAKTWENAKAGGRNTKTQIEILAIQEVRWPGKGQINKKDYQFFYSGTKEKTGQAGTGFLIMKKMQKYIISYELHNERLCKLRIKGK
jgi:hypothetical protein